MTNNIEGTFNINAMGLVKQLLTIHYEQLDELVTVKTPTCFHYTLTEFVKKIIKTKEQTIMQMNLDKYFVEEMKKNGFDVNFKQLQRIYSASRQNNPIWVARHQEKEIFNKKHN